MTPALLLILAMLASYAGFAYLALAMPRHWAQAGGQWLRTMPPRRRLRGCGFALLGVAYALIFYRDGPGFGSVLAVMLFFAAATAVALTLAFRPRLLLSFRWRQRREAGACSWPRKCSATAVGHTKKHRAPEHYTQK